MRTILCTAGTSVAQGCAALRSLQQTATRWDEEQVELRAQIQERLSKFDLASEAGRVRASAELNSLHRLDVSPEDTVVLLSTDTADGRVCAEEVERVLVRCFDLGDGNVKIERVVGLQVRDANLLRREGLPNLVTRALHYIQDPQRRYGGEIVLNPTGGFKGVVPFLTVLGMLFGLRTVYVFEFAESLIALPPLPVSFNLQLFERALPALNLVERETAVDKEAFFAAIERFQPHERDLFSGFIEREGRQVTLSTLALVLREIDSQGERLLRVSPEVAARWEQADPERRSAMERFLIRLTHPLWRSMHSHRFSGTSLNVYGEESLGVRLACILQDDAIYLCHIFFISQGEHDQYQKRLRGSRRDDYDLTTFVEWKPQSDLKSLQDAALAEEDGRMQELARENAELKLKLRDTGQPYRDELNRLRQIESDHRGCKKGLSKLQRRLSESENRIAELERYIKDVAVAATNPSEERTR